MSVGPVDSSAGNWQYAQQSTGAKSNWQNVLAAASSAVGESTSTVQQQLQSGSSLSAIASAQGVSQQSLLSAITGALQQNEQASGSTTPSSARLQQIATNIADRAPRGTGQTGGTPPGPPTQNPWPAVLSSAASVLGLSTSALQQQLQSGSSLSSIASSKGVSQQSLVSAIAGALQQSSAASGSNAPTGAQLQQTATNIANATGHHRHHHHHGGVGAAGSSTDADSTSAASDTGNSSSDINAFLAALTGSSSSSDSGSTSEADALLVELSGSTSTSPGGSTSGTEALLAAFSTTGPSSSDGSSPASALGGVSGSASGDPLLTALTGGASTDPNSLLSALLGSPTSSNYSASGTLSPAQSDAASLFSELA